MVCGTGGVFSGVTERQGHMAEQSTAGMKVFWLFLLIVLVGLGVWQGHRRLTAANPSAGVGGGGARGAMAVPVEVQPVTVGTIRDVRTFSGTLLPASHFVVAPKIAGRLALLTANVGDPVRNGQLLARIEDDEYVQRVEQFRAEVQVAEAAVTQAQSVLDVARREFARADALRRKEVASESELDASEAQFKSAEAGLQVALAQVAQRQAALRGAEIQLSYTTIHAVWENGGAPRVIGERFVDEGAMLRVGDPLLSVVDIGSLIAVITVIERDYPLMRVGQSATLTTDAYADRAFQGEVRRVAPLLQEASRQARVEIEVPNADGLLKPGMFMRVRLEFARKDDATLVPVAAIVRRDGATGVFAVDQETAVANFVPVTRGIVNSGHVEILQPPLSGVVVTLGQHLLADGSAVVLPGRGGGKPGAGRSGEEQPGGGARP